MRTRAGALLTGLALVAALAGIVGSPASGQTTPTQQQWGGYGSGTALALNALNIGNTMVANVQAAHSTAAVRTPALSTAGNDELGQNINPALPSKNAYGRGAGVEVGVLTGSIQNVDVNQIVLTQLATADAPPPTPLVTKTTPLDLSPIVTASTATGQAQATFDANTCVVGRPITFSRGYLENAVVLPNAATPNTGVAATNTQGDNVTESKTVTYLRPNGDGTFAMVTESHLLIAPVQLLGGALTLKVLGPLVMRAVATGKPGGAKIEFPNGTPLLQILVAGVPLGNPVKLDGLLPPIDIPNLATVGLGTQPHAIGGSITSAPVLASDGTSAAASYEAVRVSLQLGAGLGVLDLRIGHIEGAASVPAGGVKCNIPVAKSSSPSTISAGDDFTISISIPSDSGVFNQLFGCDLVNIEAVDVTAVTSGNVSYKLTSASNGGTINDAGDTVTWTGLGSYKRGDPPIVLTVSGHIPSSSGAGTLEDTATVSANLGNCLGSVGDGSDITGSAVTGGKVTGTKVFDVEVTRTGVLPSTGGDARLLVLGGVLLLSALAVQRKLRKPAVAKAPIQ